jgi:hypothetical protein
MTMTQIMSVVHTVLDHPQLFQPMVDMAYGVVSTHFTFDSMAKAVLAPAVRARQSGVCPVQMQKQNKPSSDSGAYQHPWACDLTPHVQQHVDAAVVAAVDAQLQAEVAIERARGGRAECTREKYQSDFWKKRKQYIPSNCDERVANLQMSKSMIDLEKDLYGGVSMHVLRAAEKRIAYVRHRRKLEVNSGVTSKDLACYDVAFMNGPACLGKDRDYDGPCS